MLRLASYDIVFQEVPGEVSLALNLSGCPNGCPGCHSPHLQTDTGELLNEDLLEKLLEIYGNSVTCVCFMGGDSDEVSVSRLAESVRTYSKGRLKTAWYTGREKIPPSFDVDYLDYIKLGPYRAALGGLKSASTNQRFYKVEYGKLIDITHLFFQ